MPFKPSFSPFTTSADVTNNSFTAENTPTFLPETESSPAEKKHARAIDSLRNKRSDLNQASPEDTKTEALASLDAEKALLDNQIKDDAEYFQALNNPEAWQQADDRYTALGTLKQYAARLVSGTTDLGTKLLTAPADAVLAAARFNREKEINRLAQHQDLVRERSALEEQFPPDGSGIVNAEAATRLAQLNTQIDALDRWLDAPNDRMATSGNRPSRREIATNIIELEGLLKPYTEALDKFAGETSKIVQRSGDVAAAQRVRDLYGKEITKAIRDVDVPNLAYYTLANIYNEIGEDPERALGSFLESLPQMLAVAGNPIVATATTSALIADTSEDFYQEFTKVNNRRPNHDELTYMQGMATIATLMDTVSDRILMRGFGGINKGIVAGAQKLGIPQNIVNTTLARISAKVPNAAQKAAQLGISTGRLASPLVGQPLQEAVSGAVTEVATQSAIRQDAPLDLEQVAVAATLEGVAAGPVTVGRTAVDAVRTVGQTIEAKAEEIKKAVGISDEVSDLHDKVVEASTIADVPEAQQEEAAKQQVITITDEIANTVNKLDEKDIITERDQAYINDLVDAVDQVDITEESIPSIKSAEEAQQTLEGAINKDEGAKESFLHSLQRGNEIEAEQAQEFSESVELTPTEKAAVDSYVEAKKSEATVAQDIKTGEGSRFTGVLTRNKLIGLLLRNGETEAAKKHVQRNKVFLAYQKAKVAALRGVADYNRKVQNGESPTVPSSVEVLATSEAGFIKNFKVKSGTVIDKSPEAAKFDLRAGVPGLEKLAGKIDEEVKFIEHFAKFGEQEVFTAEELKRVNERAAEAIQEPVAEVPPTADIPTPTTEAPTPVKPVKTEEVVEKAPIKAIKEPKAEKAPTVEKEAVETVQAPVKETKPTQYNLSTALIKNKTISTEGNQDIQNVLEPKNKKAIQDPTAEKSDTELVLESKTQDKVEDVITVELADDITEVDATTAEEIQEKPAESLLRTIQDFFKSYNKDNKIVDLTLEQHATMKRVGRFRNEFVALLAKHIPEIANDPSDANRNIVRNFTNETINKFDENPFLYFINEDSKGNRTIDPNLASTMAMVALEWIGSKGTTTLYRDNASLLSFFGLDSKTGHIHQDMEAVRTAGDLRKFVINELGRAVFKQLGLKATQNAEQFFEEKLISAIGQTMLMTMHHMDLVEFNAKKKSELDTIKQNAKIKKGTTQPTDYDAEGDQDILFVKVIPSPKDLKEANSKVNSAKELYGTSTNPDSGASIINMLTGINARKKFPSFTAQKANRISPKSNRKRTKGMLKALNFAQAQSWKIKPHFLELLKKGEDNVEFFKDLLGYERSIDQLPKKFQPGAEGQNRQIEQEITNVLEFYELLQGEDKAEFFFDYFTASNSRQFINNASFNPQGSKFVRALIGINSWETEVDPTDTQMMLGFQEALDEHLGGLSDTNISTLLVTPEVTTALDALDQGNLQDALSLINDAGAKAESLDALYALNAYRKADGKPFKTHISLEMDGTTNGVVIAHMLLGMNTIDGSLEITDRVRQAGGISTVAGQLLDSYKRQNNDNYNTLIANWQKALIDTPPSIMKEAVLSLRGDLVRDDGKPVVMQFAYGAGHSSLLHSFVMGSIDKIYNDLADPELRESTFKALAVLGIKLPTSFDVTKSTLNNVQEDTLYQAFTSVYGESLKTAIGESMHDLRTLSGTLNGSMTTTTHFFNWYINNLIEQKKKDTGKSQITKGEYNAILKDPTVQKLLPFFRDASSENAQEGLLGATIDSYTVPDIRVKTRNSRYSKIKVTDSAGNVAQKGMIDSGISSRRFVPAGMGSWVRSIQAMDDHIIRQVLETHPILSIFDATVVNLENWAEIGQAYNVALYETLDEFSPVTAAADRLVDTMRFVSKNLKAEERNAFYESVLKEAKANPSQFKQQFSLFIEDQQAPINSIGDIEQIFKRQLVITNRTKRQSQKDQKDYIKAIRTVDHLGTPTTAVLVSDKELTPLQENQLTTGSKEFINEVDDLPPDELGSAPDDTDFVPDQKNTITAENLKQTFNNIRDLDRKLEFDAPSEHQTQLSNVMDLIQKRIGQAAATYELLLQSKGDTAYGKQRENEVYLNIANEKPAYLNQQNNQEVFVHEMVHAIARPVLSMKENFSIRKELQDLMNATKKHIDEKYKGDGYKVFLHHDESGNVIHKGDPDAEIKLAKDTYGYIFNNTKTIEIQVGNQKVRESAGLHEFLAWGLTNNQLNNVLGDFIYKPSRRVREKGQSLRQTLENILLNIVDWVFHKLLKTEGKADAALMSIMFQMSKVQTKQADRIQAAFDWANRGDKFVNSRLVQHVLAPFGEWTLKKIHSTSTADKKIHFYRGLLELNPEAREVSPGSYDTAVRGYSRAMSKVRSRFTLTSQNLITEIYQDLKGPNTSYKRILEKLILESNNMIDGVRKRISKATEKAVKGSFLNPMNDLDWEALTRSMLKTDITSLFEKLDSPSVDNLLKILRNDNNERTNEINRIIKELKRFGSVSKFYIDQAQGLGNLMIKGENYDVNQGLNAYVIANSFGAPYLQLPAELTDAEQLIDQLATLYALNATSQDMNRLTAEIVQREFNENNTENGAQFLYDSLQSYKKEARTKNFDDNPILMQKGYIKETYDRHSNIKVVRSAGRAELLKRKYVEIGELAKDPLDPDKEPSYLFVSDYDGLDTRNKTILSLTNEKMRGTSVRQGNPDDEFQVGDFSLKQKAMDEIFDRNVKALKEGTRREGPVKLVPAFDSTGKVYDYRYIMTEAFKAEHLRPEMRAHKVFGAMNAAITDKVNSKKLNRQNIEIMAEDYTKNFKKEAHNFVKISANSLIPELRELYRLLPEDARKFAKDTFKGDMYIREEYIKMFFGYRDVHLLNSRIGRMVEDIWKEVIQVAKVNIVIKSWTVFKNNVISNTVAGMMHGISPVWMVKEQLKGTRYIHNFITAQQEVDELDAQIRGTKDEVKIRDLKLQQSKLIASMATNPVKPLIDMGMFQTIVEDIDLEDNPDAYLSRFSTWSKELLGLQDAAGNASLGLEIGKQAYMTKDTTTFKLLMKMTEYSDFVARYAVYTHKTEVAKDSSPEEARRIALDTYINYETPAHKWLNYANQVGLAPFTKYPIRIFRVVLMLMQGKPVTMAMVLLLENFMFGDLSTIDDSNIFESGASPWSIMSEAGSFSGIALPGRILP